MIRYKIVLKRQSILSHYTFSPMQYILHYNKGEIVKAEPKSLGIFCFKTYKQAYSFLKRSFGHDGEIIKVQPLDKRGYVPKKICAWESDIIDFYNDSKRGKKIEFATPFLGTICYKSVRVLT